MIEATAFMDLINKKENNDEIYDPYEENGYRSDHSLFFVQCYKDQGGK